MQSNTFTSGSRYKVIKVPTVADTKGIDNLVKVLKARSEANGTKLDKAYKGPMRQGSPAKCSQAESEIARKVGSEQPCKVPVVSMTGSPDQYPETKWPLPSESFQEKENQVSKVAPFVWR